MLPGSMVVSVYFQVRGMITVEIYGNYRVRRIDI
jgi:hypothetical protein